MTTPNRIALIQTGRLGEERAAGAITPGHLLILGSGDTVTVHTPEGGRAERMIALEDALQGNTITDAYASGDVVTLLHALPGDEAYVMIAAGETITIGEQLISAGDGTLKALDNVSSGITVYQVIAVAIAAVDLSASGAVATRTAVRFL